MLDTSRMDKKETPPSKPPTLTQMRNAGWIPDIHGFTLEQAFVLIKEMAHVINFKESEIDKLLSEIDR